MSAKINIVIPMVGRGSRLKTEYSKPKPLVEVEGKTILEHCVESFGIEGKYIFVIRNFEEFECGEEYTKILETTLRRLKPDCAIVKVNYLTEGPAHSVLLAEEWIDNDNPLIVTNCDQKTLWDPKEFTHFIEKNPTMDGCVVTYHRPDIVVGEKSKYSFIEVDSEGNAIQFREKFAISELALNGIHYWKQGKDFVKSVKSMMEANVRTNNEFYVSESYNFLVKDGKKIRQYPMRKGEFLALGDIQELNEFKNNKK